MSTPPVPDPPTASVSALRDGLGRVVGGAAVPYGYTVSVWTSGGLLVATHGTPTTATAFLFLLGAVGTFTVLSLVAGAPAQRHAPVPHHRIAVTSALAAAVGFGVAAMVADEITGTAAYLLVPVVATGAYFLIGALGATLAVRRDAS